MRPRASIPGLISAAIAAAVAALYVWLMLQGEILRVEAGSILWAALLWVQAGLVAFGAFATPSSQTRIALALGATALSVTGSLALFSIGAPLLVAAVLAWVTVATRRTR